MSESHSLPADIARCDGSSSVEDGAVYWREGCDTCLRRLAPRTERVQMVEPPAIIAFECEYWIGPNNSAEPGRAQHDLGSG